jgi:hypothetical protein
MFVHSLYDSAPREYQSMKIDVYNVIIFIRIGVVYNEWTTILMRITKKRSWKMYILLWRILFHLRLAKSEI